MSSTRYSLNVVTARFQNRFAKLPKIGTVIDAQQHWGMAALKIGLPLDQIRSRTAMIRGLLRAVELAVLIGETQKARRTVVSRRLHSLIRFGDLAHSSATKANKDEPTGDEILREVSCVLNPRVDVVNTTRCSEEPDESARNSQSSGERF